MKTGGERTLTAAIAAALATIGAAVPQATADVGPRAAERAALQALDATGKRPARHVVFRSPRLVPAGGAVHVARLRGGGRPDATGTTTGRMPVALRAPRRERAWLFYEDRAPGTLFEHAGRVALVGARSGDVRVSAVIQGPPSVGGELPRFLRSFAGYYAPYYRRASATLLARATRSPLAAAASRREAADRLAADRACLVGTADTLGNFHDYAAVDHSRAAVGRLARELRGLAPGVVATRYRRVSGTTLAGYLRDLVDTRGCREVSLYLAGSGFRARGETAIALGVLTRGGGRIRRQLVTAADLRELLRSRPGVWWNVTVDAPHAGALLAALRDEPNLASLQASGRPGDASHIAGRPGARSHGSLLFTRGLLDGLRSTLADQAAVAQAAEDEAGGRAPTFLSALLARGFAAGVDSRSFAALGVRPQSFTRVGPTGPGGAPIGAPKGDDVAAPSNQAPAIATSAGGTDYLENDPATAIDPGLTVTDADSPTLAGATVRIATGHAPGEDELDLPGGAPVSGSWDAAGGVLTLTGTASVADYQAALRSVTYRNASDDPATGARQIAFRVHDGNAESAPATVAVDVAGANDTPAVGLASGAVAYVEDAAPAAIDPAATVNDPDSAELAEAVVEISAGLRSGEDRLELTAPVSGIAASYDAPTGTLTLSGPAPRADYEQALRNVGYVNDSDDPDTGTRTVSVTVTDGHGATSASVGRDVTVQAVNDAPVVTAGASGVDYTENGTPVAVDPALTVEDADSGQLAGATVTVGGHVAGADVLAFANTPSITGSWNAGGGVLTLTGNASVADYQAALRSVTYHNSSENPAAGPRSIEFRATDGADESAAATQVVDVTVIDDPPTLELPAAGNLAYTENDPATPIDAGAALGDADSPTFAGATARITAGLVAAEDRLELTAPVAGVTAAYDQPTGTLTLTGPAPRADLEQALRNVAYRNVSEDPDPATRTVELRAEAAGGALTPARSRDVTVTPVNDVPVAADDDLGSTDEATALTRAAPGLLGNDDDLDDAPAVVAVQGQGSNVGVATPTDKGASVTVAADGSFSYDPSGSATLRALGEGETDTDTFTYAAGDGSASDTATVTVTVIGLPDPPEATDDSYDGVGNTTLTVGVAGPSGEPFKQLSGSVLDNDSDPDTPHEELTVEAETVATTLGGSVTIEADGNFTYSPPAGATTPDTFTYTVSDGERTDDGTVTIPLSGRVWYVDNQQAAGGLGRSGDPFDTLAEAVAASAAGDTLYVFRGSGTSAGMSSGAALKADQRLLGEAVDLVVGGHTLYDGDPANRPTIGNSGGTGVTLAAGNRVEGLNVTASATAISGSGVAGPTIAGVNLTGASGLSLTSMTGTTTIGDIAIAASGGAGFSANNVAGLSLPASAAATVSATGGPAIDVRNSSSPNVVFDSASSSNSGSAGFNVDAVTGGTVSAAAGTIAGASGPAVDVNGGTGTIAYGGAINDGAGRPAEITSRTGGSVSITGNISEDDTGISVTGNSGGATTFSGSTKTISTGGGDAVFLNNNAGHAISFTGGGLALTTTTGRGFVATGGGAVDVQGSGNTISSGTGTALEVQNTGIGSADLTFRSIASNGGANGIYLNNTTGGSGGLTVTGSGTPDSGGVIQNTAGADGSTAGVGAYLNQTRDVSLARMRFSNHQGHAIRGNTVNGLSLTDSVVNGANGTNDANDEGSILLANVSGTVTLTDTDVSGGYEDNIGILASSGMTTLQLTRVEVGANSLNLGGNGMLLTTSGTANVTTTISDSDFTSSREDLLQHIVTGNATSNFTVSGSRFSNNHANYLGGSAIVVSTSGDNADLTYRIDGNTTRDTGGGIFVQKGVGIANLRGRINNNRVGVTGVPLSGAEVGSGISVEARGQGTHTTAVTNNQVRQYNQTAYRFIAGEKSVADSGEITFNVTATGNLQAEPGAAAQVGWRMELADPNTGPAVCLDMSSNTLTGGGSLADARIQNQMATSVYRMPGYTGGPHDTAAVASYIAGRNTTTAAAVSVSENTSNAGYLNTVGGLPCPQPPA